LTAFTATPRSAQELIDHIEHVTEGRVRTGEQLHYARALVPLVHVAPSGHWRAHAKPRMVLWQGEQPTEPAATARLVASYLAAFGPASRADIAQFTYLRLRQIDPALAELGPLRRYTAEDGRELLDLPDAPEPDDRALPVRFLPKWDAALLSHADRTRILPAAIHTEVYKAVNGECLATYLIDGLVAGTWRHTRKGDLATLTLHPLTHKATFRKGRAAVLTEADRLLAFLEPDAKRHEISFD
jgi:Winged helix DNA-binding domain